MRKLVIVFILIMLIPAFAFAQGGMSDGDAAEKAMYEAGERYVLVVGVGKFKDNWIDEVKYAPNDARKFRNTLVQVLNYKEENIVMLLNEDATLENIVDELKGLSKKATGKDDTIMFYYSGHGVMIGKENFVFPHDTKVKSGAESGVEKTSVLGVDEIVNKLLYDSPARKLLLLDACRRIIEDKSFGSTTNIDFEDNDIVKNNDDVIIVSSTESGQLAYESTDPKINNSIFTYSFITTLRDKNTDSNDSKYISLSEILDETSKLMVDLCKKENAPIIQKPSINVGNTSMLDKMIMSEAVLGFVPQDIDPFLEEIDFDQIINENSDSFDTAVKNAFDNFVEKFKDAISKYENNDFKEALDKYEDLRDDIENNQFYAYAYDDPEKAKPFEKLYDKADEAIMKLNDYFDKSFLNDIVSKEFEKVKFCQEVYIKSYSNYYNKDSNGFENTKLLINGRYMNMTAIVIMEDLLNKDLTRNNREVPLSSSVKDAIKSKISELKNHLELIEKQLLLDCKKNKDNKEYYNELVDILSADVNQNERYKKDERKNFDVTDKYDLKDNKRIQNLKEALDRKVNALGGSLNDLDPTSVTNSDLDDLEDKLDDLRPTKSAPGYNKAPYLNRITKTETDIMWETKAESTSQIIVGDQVKETRAINRYEISTAELVRLMGNNESIIIYVASTTTDGQETTSSVEITREDIKQELKNSFETDSNVKQLKTQLSEAKDKKDYNKAKKASNALIKIANEYNNILDDTIDLDLFKVNDGRMVYLQTNGGLSISLNQNIGAATLLTWNGSLNFRINRFLSWGLGVELFSPEVFVKLSIMNNYNPLKLSFPTNELYIKVSGVVNFWPGMGIGLSTGIGDIIRFSDFFGVTIYGGINFGVNGGDPYNMLIIRLGTVFNF